MRWASLGIAFLFWSLSLPASAKEWPPTYFVAPCTCRGSHGDDRWKAKTDRAPSPRDARQILSVTPSEMYAWRPLAGLTTDSRRHAPEEEQWYRVVGRVVEVKAEDDGDIHFQMEDAKGGKRGAILAEVPLGAHWCELRKAVFAWTQKGLRFTKFQASSHALPLRSNPVVTVYGKAFFDVHHAPKQLANRSRIDPTGQLAAWEIHPVARIDEEVEVRRALPVIRQPSPR